MKKEDMDACNFINAIEFQSNRNMVKDTEKFLKAKELVRDWLELGELPGFEISWGYRKDFTTSDPFERVKTSPKKVILKKYYRKKDKYRFIDIVRGLIHQYLDESFQETSSGWHLCTLVALIIIPSTLVRDEIKSSYRRFWKSFEEEFARAPRYDYQRIFRILSAFPRKNMERLLSRFFVQIHGTISLESQLNSFLISSIQLYYQPEDIEILQIALENQTMNIKAWQELLPEKSPSSLYRTRSRLSLQLGEYLVHSKEFLGLTRLFIPDQSEEIISDWRSSVYFENTIHFVDTDNIQVIMAFPRSQYLELTQLYEQFVVEKPVYLVLSDPSETRVSPAMFSSEEERWMSVFQANRASFPMLISKPGGQDIPTREELEVLKALIHARSDDFRKIGSMHSLSRTKQIIRRLKQQNAYFSAVLWWSPANLPTATFFVELTPQLQIDRPLQDFTRGNEWLTFLEDELLAKHTDTQILDEIKDYSWPYLIIQICSKMRFDQDLMVQKIALLQVTAVEEDIERLANLDPKVSLWGIHGHRTGTNIVIPVENYKNGRWEIDVKELVRRIGNGELDRN